MAQKRMFDKAIIDTDGFMDLGLSSKALYFLLGMEADDEGFVSYKKVMRIHGGNEDDIKVLVAKKFLIAFPSGVVVITDWNKNNWLDSRRLKETEYQKEKKMLLLTSSNKYELSTGLTSIEESSIEENRRESDFSSQVFSLKEEIKKLEDSSRRDLNIIALFLEEKKPQILSREQLQVTIRRHLRAAKNLSPYTDLQITDSIPKAKRLTPEWTLETLVKILTK